MAEFRKALAGVERERDQLLAEKEQRERAAKEAAAVVASARRRAGDGGLSAERRSSLASAASGALPSPSAWFGGGGGGEAPLPSPLPSVRQRDTLEATDVLYLKNGELTACQLLPQSVWRRRLWTGGRECMGWNGWTASCAPACAAPGERGRGRCCAKVCSPVVPWLLAHHVLQCCSSSWTRMSGVWWLGGVLVKVVARA